MTTTNEQTQQVTNKSRRNAPKQDATIDEAIRQLEVAKLVIDTAVTIRSKMSTDGFVDKETVQRYAESIEHLPPILVYELGDGTLLVADGFHRVAAHKLVGRDKIAAIVRQGTRDEALVAAATANVTHGRPLSNADIKAAGRRLLSLGKKPAEVARLMYRTREWAGQLKTVLEIEAAVPVKILTGIPDSVLVAVAPAGREQWENLLKVQKASGWTVDLTRQAAKLVSEHGEYLRMVADAAKDGKALAVKDGGIQTLPPKNTAPAGREAAKREADAAKEQTSEQKAETKPNETPSETPKADESATDEREEKAKTPDVLLASAIAALVELQSATVATVVEAIPHPARKSRARLLRKATKYLKDLTIELGK